LNFLDNFFGAIREVFAAFRKSPEEKERERIKKQVDTIANNAREVIDAVSKAKSGNTADLERILSRL
jgi:hypothetical protein